MSFTVDMPDSEGKGAVNAADFGLDEKLPDNTAALMNAIVHCRAEHIGRLDVDKGVYHFQNEAFISFSGMRDFTFDGHNAEFIFDGPYFFEIDGCERVAIRNTITDYNWDKNRLGNLVRVLSVDREGLVLTLEFMEIADVDPDIDIMTMNRFDPQTLTPGLSGGKEYWIMPDTLVRREKGAAANILRLWFRKGAFEGIQPGEIYLARHVRKRQGAAFRINDSAHVTLKANTVYSAYSAAHIVTGKSEYIRLDGVKIGIRPGANRRLSTEADGFHIAQSRGHVIIENCDFSFMGDDAVNIHDGHFFVSEVLSPRSLKLRNASYGEAGDVLEIKNPDFSPSGHTLTLQSLTRAEGARETVLFFEEDIPAFVKEGNILINKSYNSGNYIIRNNYFHENRARGLLLQCDNGLVENNRFYRTQGAAVYIMLEALKNLWYEGSGVRNLMIRDNSFTDCNCGDWSSVIDAVAIIPDETSEYPVFNDITIENNTLSGFPSLAMYLSTADNLMLNANKIYPRAGQEELIIAERCGKISLNGNTAGGKALTGDDIIRSDSCTTRRKLLYLKPLYPDV